MNFDAISKNVKIFKIRPVEPKLWKIREITLLKNQNHVGGKNHSHVKSENLVRSPGGGKFQWQLQKTMEKVFSMDFSSKNEGKDRKLGEIIFSP